MLEKIKEKFKENVRMPYYYVPECPICGSRMTGRYMRYLGDTSSEWQVNEALRNGELVDIVNEVPWKNCFCCQCDYEWHEDIKMKMKTLKEIGEEKKARGTINILNNRMKEEKIRRQNDHGLFKGFRRFIGKI